MSSDPTPNYYVLDDEGALHGPVELSRAIDIIEESGGGQLLRATGVTGPPERAFQAAQVELRERGS